MRVGAVVTGVVVAIFLSSVFGLTWWSLGITVAVALVIAQLLRLGDQMLEAPISAMLILAVGGNEMQAETRVINTLVGMSVGMLISLVVAPAVPSRQAATEIRRLGEGIAGSLRGTAASMREHPITLGQAGHWLDDIRGLGGQVSTAARRVQEIHETRRLNPRAIRTYDAEPELRRNLETVERVLAAVRALYTVLLREAPAGAATEDTFGAEVRPAFAVVLEKVPEPLAERITARVAVPTIGIGASPQCDGQILVVDDMLGAFTDFQPTFVHRYAELGRAADEAIAAYAADVRARRFPTAAHVFADAAPAAPDGKSA